MGVEPLVPINSLSTRLRTWEKLTGKKIQQFICDIAENSHLYKIVNDFRPEAIVHFVEQPSAPYR